jgi:hypothetical protein
MFSRVLAAACAAALGVGALAAPVEVAARGGAVSIGHAGGFRPSAMRPFHRARAPFAHARHVLPAAPLRGAFVRALRAGALRHHRIIYGGFGYPLTYADGAPFYGSYYDPSDVVGTVTVPASAAPPADPAPYAERDAQAAVDRGGCRSETVTIPASGGERSITITRC